MTSTDPNESSQLLSQVSSRVRPTLRSRLSGLLWNRQDQQVANTAVNRPAAETTAAHNAAAAADVSSESGSRRASATCEPRVLMLPKTLSRPSTTLSAKPERLEPELHVIGQIVGFKGHLDNTFAAFRIVAGHSWDSVGAVDGIQAQTQVDYGQEGCCIWNHPVDGHWFTSAMQGWPRIYFQLFSLDCNGACQHEGYSVCWIPYSPGHHHLECAVWRPSGTPSEEVAAYFIGLNPSLTSTDVLLESAKEERCKLVTKSVGTIICELDVLTRNFSSHRIDWF